MTCKAKSEREQPREGVRESEMSVLCGNCKEHHSSANEVRECYGVNTRPMALASAAGWYNPAAGNITERQIDLIDQLRQERAEEPLTGWASWSKAQASEEIQRLLNKPKALGKSAAPAPTVPNGRYALRMTPEVTKFYRVNSPTEGRWVGRTFVEVQASDDFYPINNKVDRETILRMIADNPQAAMELYGRELGKCGHCGRTLTDEESRARGIGPICASRMSW